MQWIDDEHSKRLENEKQNKLFQDSFIRNHSDLSTFMDYFEKGVTKLNQLEFPITSNYQELFKEKKYFFTYKLYEGKTRQLQIGILETGSYIYFEDNEIKEHTDYGD